MADAQKESTPLPIRGRAPKRFHRKSRLGCLACRKRRVKCDEGLPSCSRCIDFGISCPYNAQVASSESQRTGSDLSPPTSESDQQALQLLLAPPKRKGPGRPRKNWAISLRPSPPVPSATPSPQSLFDGLGLLSGLEHGDARLLHHFTLHAGRTLVSTRDQKHPMIEFWTCSVPRVGLEYSYVQDFLFAYAALHLHHLQPPGGHSDRDFKVACRHLSTGISQLNTALVDMNSSNCCGLLTASMLVTSCTFAAGPSTRGDLLLCDLNTPGAGRILGLMRGHRLVQETFDQEDLWKGLTKHLHPKLAATFQEDNRASCLLLGYPRVDWIEPLTSLRGIVCQEDSDEDRGILLSALDIVWSIYDAVYGDVKGFTRRPSHYKMILFFVYFIEDEFVAKVQQSNPVALLILAYYAPLLKADPYDWHLHSWAKHIVQTIHGVLSSDYAGLLEWPKQVICS